VECPAAVRHFHANLPVGAGNADSRDLASGVTVNVREAFLHDAENSGFQFLWEPLELIGNFQGYFDFAALAKSFQEQTETRRKTDLIQKRRMQQMSDRSHLV
jgi:hypothetical protein